MPHKDGVSDVVRASQSLSVGVLLAEMARAQPDAVAVEQGPLQLSYREFNTQVNRLAHAFQRLGIARGDRVALLSENRHEYLLVQLACAKLGAITGCLNWRLASEELGYCARLVEPSLLVFSSKYRETVGGMLHGASGEICIDDDLGRLMEGASDREPDAGVDPEDGLIIVYTSGTTGFPKGAVISHRAMLARAALFHLCVGGDKDDAFIAWSGMFHMAGADFCLGTLLLGGRVVVVDGVDLPAIAAAVTAYPVSYLGLQPGMIRRVVDYF